VSHSQITISQPPLSTHQCPWYTTDAQRYSCTTPLTPYVTSITSASDVDHTQKQAYKSKLVEKGLISDLLLVIDLLIQFQYHDISVIQLLPNSILKLKKLTDKRIDHSQENYTKKFPGL